MHVLHVSQCQDRGGTLIPQTSHKCQSLELFSSSTDSGTNVSLKIEESIINVAIKFPTMLNSRNEPITTFNMKNGDGPWISKRTI